MTKGKSTTTDQNPATINELQSRYNPVFERLKAAGLLEAAAGFQMSKDLSIAEVTGSHNSEYLQNVNMMYEAKTNSSLREMAVTEFDDLSLTEDELKLKYEDPETFLYMMILKKMKKNPNAGIKRKIKREVLFANEKPRGDGKVNEVMKPLKYQKRTRNELEMLNTASGLVAEEDDKYTQQLKRR